jgi:hypothetical protein
MEKSYIPNIMLFTDYNDYIITLPSQPNFIIKQNDKIKCYDKDNKEINIEVIEVIYIYPECMCNAGIAPTNGSARETDQRTRNKDREINKLHLSRINNN